MGENPPPAPRPPRDAADAACEVIELLEVLWDRGRDAISPAPVSASQLRVLYSLEREDGINLRTLGELLGSGPSSVSRLCDRLQAVGLVERAPSPVSRRELELRLTGQGRRYLSELRAQRVRVLRTAVAGMPARARKALVEGLGAFRTAVDDSIPARERGRRGRTERSA